MCIIVTYLMYGPYGAFAPYFDSSFATLTRMDSSLLYSVYGDDVGVTYAHRLCVCLSVCLCLCVLVYVCGMTFNHLQRVKDDGLVEGYIQTIIFCPPCYGPFDHIT